MELNNEKFSENQGKLYGFVAMLMVIVSAFGIGVYIGGDSAVRRINEQGITATQPLEEIEFDLNYLKQVAAEIEANYLGELPSQQEINRGLAKGLVDSLKDQYSSYLDPIEAGEFGDSADSAYEGIGVYLGFEGDYTSILSPIDGYPGAEAGLMAGDLILEIDGVDVAGERPEVTSRKILGESGTTVKLVVFRPDDGELHEFEIKRQRIDLENVSFKDLGSDIYLIDVIRFTEGEEGGSNGVQVFNRTWDKVASQVAEKNPKGIVIDLRNNPGGFVNSVRYAVEDFLNTGEVIMQEEEKSKAIKIFKDDRKGQFEDIPIVVLINGGSASASEIFAGAIQDNKRGTILGTETYGKGVEQIITEISDGSLIMLTYKRWLTPTGKQISPENPINPDQEVEFVPAAELGGEYDSQVKKAIEILLGN